MLTRLRRAALNYLAALTFSAGIVAVPSSTGRGRSAPPIVRLAHGKLIGGRWAPGEVSLTQPEAVVTVVPAGPDDQSSLFFPN